MLHRLLTIAVVGLTLASCDNAPSEQSESPTTDTQNDQEVDQPEDERDVAYFLDNPDERRAVREECRNDPGNLQFTAACMNADEANKQARRQRTRELLGE